MSLELFINSGSISEIDLSRIDGVRFEDAFSIAPTTCASLYYNTQEFSIPPITPIGVLNIPETNYFMFDDDASSDWNGATPTKIRISLKALGRLVGRTSYQQKLIDIIKNSRVDSEITFTKITGNASDPKSYKKFKIVEANYLERIYDDNGNQKFYSLEWGGADLTETADFTGLFDYLSSSEDRKDGFFTLIVTQIDTDVNSVEPPQQGDELLICITPSSKYGTLDVVDGTFDDLVSNTSTTISASVGSLTVTGDIIFVNTASLEKALESVLAPRRERTVYLTPQYVDVPKWAKEAYVTVIGGGGGGGAGASINDAHYTIGGSGGSGGSIAYNEMLGKLYKYIPEIGGIKTPARDWKIYVHPGAGGRGGVAREDNTEAVSSETDAIIKFVNTWNSFYAEQPNRPVANGGGNSENLSMGSSPYFYGLNIDYAFSLLFGDLQLKYMGRPIQETYPSYLWPNNYIPNRVPDIKFYDFIMCDTFDETTWVRKYGPITVYEWNRGEFLDRPNRNDPNARPTNNHWWYERSMVTTQFRQGLLFIPIIWFNDFFVKIEKSEPTTNMPYGSVSVIDGTLKRNKGADIFLFNPLILGDDIDYYAKTNVKKIYKAMNGENGSPSYATLIDFTEINKESDLNKKSQLLREEHIKNVDIERKETHNVWATGGSGGQGGLAIKYSKNIKNAERNSFDGKPEYFQSTFNVLNLLNTDENLIDFSITPFGTTDNRFNRAPHTVLGNSKNNWAHRGWNGVLFVMKNDVYPAKYPTGKQGETFSKLWNPIPLVEAATSENPNLWDNPANNNIYISDPWKIWSSFSLDLFSIEYVKGNNTKPIISQKIFRGGNGGYGVVEPLHLNSVMQLKTHRKQIISSVAANWSITKDTERFSSDLSGIPSREGRPIDYYLNSSPNSPQTLVTETSPSLFFTKPHISWEHPTMHTRMRRWTYSMDGIDISNLSWQNTAQLLAQLPKIARNYSRPLDKGAFQDEKVGVTGGGGGIGWAGFDPIGKHHTTGELIDIMDMPSSYLGELKNQEYPSADFNYITFYNYGNHKHIRIGKGGTHSTETIGDQRFQIGGDGGNAIKRWVLNKDTLAIETILEPSLPNNTPPNPILVDGKPIITWGAGGGAGGSGGIDIGSVDASDIIVNGIPKGGGGYDPFEYDVENQITNISVPISALLDENNEWRKVLGQNGANGYSGCVIIEFVG